ncbi:MAG: hypothetical protein JXR89_03635, partial [Deltaproteobacteria bacterium]|nr:hypothetical protein [Deltaproteobacteria bacterium]
LLRRLCRRPEFFRTLFNDLAYYRACAFFDGRQPPDSARLKAFAPRSAGSFRGPIRSRPGR